MIYDLPWFTVILTFINMIISRLVFLNTETSQNVVGKLGLKEQSARSECIQK